MKRNIVIFLIIIILFVVLTIVGFLIYWAQNGFSAFGRRSRSDTSGDDEEEMQNGALGVGDGRKRE
ncbi:hypothetical protein BJ546DRAFT_1061221 [Cryomyces antarcticus]